MALPGLLAFKVSRVQPEPPAPWVQLERRVQSERPELLGRRASKVKPAQLAQPGLPALRVKLDLLELLVQREPLGQLVHKAIRDRLEQQVRPAQQVLREQLVRRATQD